VSDIGPGQYTRPIVAAARVLSERPLVGRHIRRTATSKALRRYDAQELFWERVGER